MKWRHIHNANNLVGEDQWFCFHYRITIEVRCKKCINTKHCDPDWQSYRISSHILCTRKS